MSLRRAGKAGPVELGRTSDLLFFDDCASAGLPAGVTASGQLTYDAANKRRVLGGTSISDYYFALQMKTNVVILEVDWVNLNASTSGIFVSFIQRGNPNTANLAFINSQSDGNEVITTGAGAVVAATTTSGASFPPVGYMRTYSVFYDITNEYLGGLITRWNDAAAIKVTSGASAGTAGVALGEWFTFRLETQTTRQVAIYGVSVRAVKV